MKVSINILFLLLLLGGGCAIKSDENTVIEPNPNISSIDKLAIESITKYGIYHIKNPTWDTIPELRYAKKNSTGLSCQLYDWDIQFDSIAKAYRELLYNKQPLASVHQLTKYFLEEVAVLSPDCKFRQEQFMGHYMLKFLNKAEVNDENFKMTDYYLTLLIKNRYKDPDLIITALIRYKIVYGEDRFTSLKQSILNFTSEFKGQSDKYFASRKSFNSMGPKALLLDKLNSEYYEKGFAALTRLQNQ